jgi:hypothetical protein
MASTEDGSLSGAAATCEGTSRFGADLPSIQVTANVASAHSPKPISAAVGCCDVIIAAKPRNAEAAPKVRAPEKLDCMKDGCHPAF